MQLQPMADQLEPELPRDALLQPLDVLIAEFDHLSGLEVDEVVVVFARGFFVPPPACPELAALEDAVALKQVECPVDGR